jgi:hypothetical protein
MLFGYLFGYFDQLCFRAADGANNDFMFPALMRCAAKQQPA